MGFGQCLSPPRGVRSVSINDGWGNGLLEMDLHLGSLFVIWPTGCVILYDLGLLFLWMSSSLPELSENFVVKLSPNLQNKLKISLVKGSTDNFQVRFGFRRVTFRRKSTKTTPPSCIHLPENARNDATLQALKHYICGLIQL